MIIFTLFDLYLDFTLSSGELCLRISLRDKSNSSYHLHICDLEDTDCSSRAEEDLMKAISQRQCLFGGEQLIQSARLNAHDQS